MVIKGYAWRFSAKFWQLAYRMYYNAEYLAVGFDALRSTIGRVAMLGFSAYCI